MVKEAKLQAYGHIGQVDWETGEILEEWNIHLNDLAGVMNKISYSLPQLNHLDEYSIPQEFHLSPNQPDQYVHKLEALPL